MTSGHVYIATSLDGFVAREDHSLDWLMKQNTGSEDHGYEDFMARMDGLIMGTGSFRTVLGFDPWPYQKPVVVMSQSLSEDDIPETLRHKVSITRLGPKALMEDLEKKGWKRAYVDGGRVVQSFLREKLISDLQITLAPILIGSGVSLFGPLEADQDLKLEEVKKFESGLLMLRYSCL